jgi:alkylation response protein AidB-like acyl-CoA dehydrogenase
LSGRVQGVLDGGGATHVMVYLADGRPALAAVEGEGVRAKLVATLDRSRPLLDVTFEAAPAVVLSAANDPQAARTRVLDAGRVMLAADTLGAAQSMFDQAVAFAKERVQFGRVIGSFQGVKHTLADLATSLEPCRALVWFAAHAQDALPDEARVAALQAKAHLDDVGREVARLSTEVHGGMGFTDLQGLHYWWKRVDTNRQLLGTPERCRHDAAVVQGWISA